eukprot:8398530-Pyramimonas_sp.AAC.1
MPPILRTAPCMELKPFSASSGSSATCLGTTGLNGSSSRFGRGRACCTASTIWRGARTWSHSFWPPNGRAGAPAQGSYACGRCRETGRCA